VRFGSRVGVNPAFFNMSRTDAAGAAILAAALVFAFLLLKILRG